MTAKIKKVNDKTELLTLRVSAEEKRILEGQAKAMNMNMSEFLRTAALMDCMMSGNPDAAKYIFTSVSGNIKQKIRDALFDNSRIASEDQA